ncbi:MAG: ribulose-phosphate 3-epimerase [Gemmatimonadales bacterium]|nr:MAG: ribulose-phosphate 3-epimerase [Gemmatimonadales bacterium]
MTRTTSTAATTSRPPRILAPSILSADFGRLAEDVKKVEEAGADWIHVDVMDGHFVPNLTIGPAVTEAVRRITLLPIDVHLMIESPERFVEAFAGAGADRITVHQEVCPHLNRVMDQIREAGALPGVALNPSTPVSTLSEVVGDLDLLLIMTVNPGFGGQSFLTSSLGKVARARALLDQRGTGRAHLQVDGGVDDSTIGLCAEAGADSFVAGSAVYGHADGAQAGVAALRKALSQVNERRA